MTQSPSKARATGGKDADSRPVSPHLQIYRWQWTMALSIAHRLTGLYISAGVVFLCLKLFVASFGESEHFAMFEQTADRKEFVLFKALFVWCLLHHMLSGVRHLVWDTGRAFALRSAAASGYFVAFLSLFLTVLYLRYWL